MHKSCVRNHISLYLYRPLMSKPESKLHIRGQRVRILRPLSWMITSLTHARVQSLDISDNALAALPGGVCAPGHWERLTSLTVLDLRGNPLASLPRFRLSPPSSIAF
jgi:Leucine-rich repeat (LRR) protein